MQAVILVGGLGTRLRKMVSDVPKPMAPVGEKPFLEILIQNLKNNGIHNILLLTGYKARLIENYFKTKQEGGLNIRFSKEKKPLGTAGALFNAWKNLEDEFIVLNGDTFFDIQYKLFFKFIKENNCSSLIALTYSNNISRYGFVDISSNFLVENFIEKGNLPQDRVDGYINGGIYYFKKEVLSQFYNKWQGGPISIEKEIFPHLTVQRKLYGLPLGGLFIDIGIPEDFQRAQNVIPRWLKKEKKPSLFIDRDGVIIRDPGYIHGTNLIFIKKTFDIVRKANEEGKYVFIVTNQAGIAKGKFTEKAAIETNKYIISVYRKKGLKIDKAYYCPYHVDGIIQRYRKRSILRKPDPGMILVASQEYPIDILKSVMLGDKDSDKINLFGLDFSKFIE